MGAQDRRLGSKTLRVTPGRLLECDWFNEVREPRRLATILIAGNMQHGVMLSTPELGKLLNRDHSSISPVVRLSRAAFARRAAAKGRPWSPSDVNPRRSIEYLSVSMRRDGLLWSEIGDRLGVSCQQIRKLVNALATGPETEASVSVLSALGMTRADVAEVLSVARANGLKRSGRARRDAR